MKNVVFKALGAGVAVATVALGSSAAMAATASADAKAKILAPVTVTKTADLDFGTIVTGTVADTVQISTAGARTCGTNLVCSGAVSAAGFTVDGTTGETVTVSIPASVTLTSGANSMSASLVRSAPTVLLTAGVDSFTVGGTLSVAANQADGSYLGTFTATVNYQ